MKALLVDHDKSFLLGVQRHLTKSKIFCKSALNLQDAASLLNQQQFDCIIIAEGIANGHGLILLQSLKSKQRPGNIIILLKTTSQHSEADFLADDSISKASCQLELVNKIKKAMGKSIFGDNTNLVFGELRVDVNEQMVYVANKPVPFNKMEKTFFFLLIVNKNKVVFNTSLSRYLLNNSIRDNHSIYQQLKNVRKKLTLAGFPDHIVNVHGVGYRFDW